MMFKNHRALENMGRVNCMVLEKQGTFTNIQNAKIAEWWMAGCKKSFEKFSIL